MEAGIGLETLQPVAQLIVPFVRHEQGALEKCQLAFHPIFVACSSAFALPLTLDFDPVGMKTNLVGNLLDFLW